MARLIIDGNSVFEIDEECLKRRKPPLDCDVEKYLNEDLKKDAENTIKNKRTVD